MARHDFYCQCKLERDNQVMISWIPADIAKVGNKVRLRNSAQDPWDEDWLVTFVGNKQKGDLVEAASRDHLHQREVSDV